MRDVRYATTRDGVTVAYQVVGDGPVDLITALGSVTHQEVNWEYPPAARFYERLASFARLILFDKRGTGMSDRVGIGTLEARMDDLRAVADAVGASRPFVLGVSEGGPMSILYAATYPDRTAGLVLYGSMVRGGPGPDDPEAPVSDEEWAGYEERLASRERHLREHWGEPFGLDNFAPSRADDELLRAWVSKLMRYGSSPSAMIALSRMNAQIDVRGVLSSIRVPALVLHRADDHDVSVLNGRYLASHIEGAKYVELSGEDHFPYLGDADALVDEIELFTTGANLTREVERVLTTIVFTDIVGSTAKGAAIGDLRWRELLESHASDVHRALKRGRGIEVKSTGDGFLTRFDGPARAVRFALDVVQRSEEIGLRLRAGVHTGEVELVGDDVSGIAVNLCQRVQSIAEPGEVLATSTVRDLVAGSGLRFEGRGEHTLRGVPGRWALFAAS